MQECSSGCCGCGAEQIKISIEQFQKDPLLYKPLLYKKFQLDALSEAGRNAYLARIKAYNCLCEKIDRKDIAVDVNAPWDGESTAHG